MREQRNGFSLMEMMVVLLIVAIIAAASAPMVSKNMARNAGSGDSPWVFTGTSNSIAYNMRGDANSSAIIGATALPANAANRPKLYVQSRGDEPQIGFGRSGSSDMISLTMDTVNNRVGFSNATIPARTVAFGTGQIISATNTYSTMHRLAVGNNVEIGPGSIAVGANAKATGDVSMALGGTSGASSSTRATAFSTVAVGIGAWATTSRAVSFGLETIASGDSAIALGAPSASGRRTEASGRGSIAIGQGANAEQPYSVAIGYGAQANSEHQIVLGTDQDTVYIPGNLVVRGDVALGSSGHSTYISTRERDNGQYFHFIWQSDNNKVKTNGWFSDVWVGGKNYSAYSDRRLKNVGEKFTSGLEKIKELKVYNYTFKKDETKTPHVGVIAQDLRKVFPDAVTKGEDGYLRIRFEDMFYALVNAVKELDEKITNAFDNIANLNKRLDDQEKIIKQLQEQNKKLETRLAELEKK